MFERVVRKTLRAASRCPGYLPLVRRLRSRDVAIVMYHGVTRRELPVFNWCQLDIGRFQHQLEFLTATYTVLPLAEVVRRLSTGASLPARTASVTFDDAFRNVYTTAYPLLKQHHAPATVFVVTSLAGTRQPAWPGMVYHAIISTRRTSVTFDGVTWPLASAADRSVAHITITARLKTLAVGERDARLSQIFDEVGTPPPVDVDSPLATMDWNEIQELAKTGLIDFGSHTHTHPILSRCDEAKQRDELRISRDILRDRLGVADLFAYPNGTRADFSDRTKSCLVDLGYLCGLSTVPGLNSANADLYALRRVNVGADTEFTKFEMAMTGL
jgi:peptidoglycan/xylan/chitin deacetylase (PgdA/CDA1 family)